MPAVTEPSTCTVLCAVSFLTFLPPAVVVSDPCPPFPVHVVYFAALSYACVSPVTAERFA